MAKHHNISIVNGKLVLTADLVDGVFPIDYQESVTFNTIGNKVIGFHVILTNENIVLTEEKKEVSNG
jgi:hypothetical protein